MIAEMPLEKNLYRAINCSIPRFVLVLALILQILSVANTQTPPENVPKTREVAKKVLNSVVSVVTEDSAGVPISQGSGFYYLNVIQEARLVISDKPIKTNYVVTSLHVFKYAFSGFVRLVGSERKFRIKSVVAYDLKNDICLIEVEGPARDPLRDHSGSVEVGDEVMVAGNPKGLVGTLSKGIVSSLRPEQNLIQMDAISPGSSGGPVVNESGEVIGITVSTLRGGTESKILRFEQLN